MTNIVGMKLIVPSSVAGTGVSVSASGKVTFTAATDISINNCFSSSYDNYLIVMRMKPTAGNPNIQARFRSSGTNASGSDYTRQYLTAESTTVNSARQTGQTSAVVGFASSSESGVHIYIYGPYLSQPTATRSVCVSAFSGGYLQDDACTHSLSTSYDGIFLYPSSNGITGSMTVYGFSQ